ncbi:MAG: rod shape-determining protein MreC, partial [Caulobacter sp.]|nr:rod shape-determining protein MreC [Vitreoscilla sp.]
IYPPGLDVAKVVKVDPRADSSFARIALSPAASADGVRHVLVHEPMAMQLPARPAPAPEPAKDKNAKSAKGGRK